MNLTPNTIIEAAEKKANAEYELYRVESTGRGEWNVTRWNDAGRDYTVKADSETYNWTCDCPAYEKTGQPCKHVFIARLHEAELAADEARADAFDQDAAHCIGAGKF